MSISYLVNVRLCLCGTFPFFSMFAPKNNKQTKNPRVKHVKQYGIHVQETIKRKLVCQFSTDC